MIKCSKPTSGWEYKEATREGGKTEGEIVAYRFGKCPRMEFGRNGTTPAEVASQREIVITEGEKEMSGGKGTPQNGNSSSKVYIIIFVVIAAIVVGIVVYYLMRNKGAADDTRDVGGSARLIVDEGNAGNIMDEMRKEVEEGMFECNMSSTWTFADGTSESKDAIVANSINNSYPFYFDVMLEGTEELLYSSPVVPVGARVTDIKLEKDLDPGEYEATVLYSLLEDEESQEVKSQAGFVITIVVQN